MLADCANLEKPHIITDENTLRGSRQQARQNLCAAIALTHPMKVRGCMKVVVEHKPMRHIPSPYVSDKNIKKFADMLKDELCHPKVVAKQKTKRMDKERKA
jgi:hypothetical protein